MTANLRKTVYVLIAVAGVALGALTTAYASLDLGNPSWLVVALSVYTYLAGGSGILAVLNVLDGNGDGEPVVQALPTRDAKGRFTSASTE